MNLISINYCVFVLIIFMLYYVFPKRYRWCVLLAGSMAYYIIVCKWYVCFILFTIATTYGIAIWIQHMLEKESAVVKAHKGEWDKETRRAYKAKGLRKRMLALLLGLVLNFGILCFLKYVPLAGALGILLPLGISFYTFQSMGYLIDVYREIVEPEKNIFRFALFVSFFPQIIQGPIAIYDKFAAQLYEGHSFDWERIKRALLLILWGLMKKLIIADRAVNYINTVLADTNSYSGTFILATVLVYAVQLYTDFSGGIDIVRGIGELFGITMPVNFNRPYFSRSLTEYWHRWHMTLGDWCRNYIFYPLSISKASMNSSKWLKPRLGNHISKVLPSCIASLITFIVIGVWHGPNMKYFYFGLWNGLVIMIGELIAPITGWIAERFFKVTHLKKGGIISTCVSVCWTLILVLIGYFFDIAQSSKDAFWMIKQSVFDVHISDLTTKNLMEILKPVGLAREDYMLLIIATMFLFVVSLIQEKIGVDYKDFILKRKLPIRWIILIAGIVAVAVFGYYGPGVNPADFVYMQF